MFDREQGCGGVREQHLLVLWLQATLPCLHPFWLTSTPALLTSRCSGRWLLSQSEAKAATDDRLLTSHTCRFQQDSGGKGMKNTAEAMLLHRL